MQKYKKSSYKASVNYNNDLPVIKKQKVVSPSAFLFCYAIAKL